MKISALDEYGLRCVLQLARSGTDGSLTLGEIAEREGMTVAYVGKLLGILRQAGLVQSVRGRAGGYRLAEPPENLSVARVIHALGGPTWQTSGCDKFNGNHDVCVHTFDCSIRALWGAVDSVVEQILVNVTLADLLSPEHLSAERLRHLPLFGSPTRPQQEPQQV